MELILEAGMEDISIHAPRMGSDSNIFNHPTFIKLFQSTLPAWGATGRCLLYKRCFAISIHAPRMGSDGNLLFSRANF